MKSIVSMRKASTAVAAIALFAAACSSSKAPDELEQASSGIIEKCAFSVKKNVYDGHAWWGTLTLRNDSGGPVSGVVVSFDVPEGVHCDYTPEGWTKSQKGNNCRFEMNKGNVAAGDDVTLSYSTDSQDLDAVVHVVVEAKNCGSTDSGGGSSNNTPGKGSWQKADMTHYDSYPAPGSEECVKYDGCRWAGQFAALDKKQSRDWVQSHNIVSVHSKNFSHYKLKTLRLRQGSHTIDATVYDECADSDCSGCCTRNSRDTGFLIDVEKYTFERFGGHDGVIEWTCLDCD